MQQSELVKLNFQGRHMAIKSFIQVFQLQINEAIASSEEFLIKGEKENIDAGIPQSFVKSFWLFNNGRCIFKSH